MYLKEITIKNFRGVENATCIFNPDLNLIIGSNDSGKTALIDSIRFLLRQVVDDYTRLTEDDFRDKTKRIEFSGCFAFDEIEDEAKRNTQAARFAEYLSFNKNKLPELRVWYSLECNEDSLKFTRIRAGSTEEVATQIDTRCRELLKVLYLRPLRDAEADLKARKGSRISKLLHSHASLDESARKILEDLLQAFKDGSKDFFETGKGSNIRDEIQRLLSSFDERSLVEKKEIEIGPTEKVTDLKTLEKLALFFPNESKAGLGTLNMLFIAAELMHLTTQQVPKLILIEEVESHLHPQRQLKIMKALQVEAANHGIQMILTSHSPNLASAVNVQHLNVCQEGKFLSLGFWQTALEKKNYAYLGRFLDVTKSNLFFARGVLLVEGVTELLIIPELVKMLGSELIDTGISVVAINNLGFDHFANIFKRTTEPFNLTPVAIVTDADKKSLERLELISKTKSDASNKVQWFIGQQLCTQKEISKARGTTFEKIILQETDLLKGYYIRAFNSLKRRRSALNSTMTTQYLYSRIEKEKAPVAQEVALQLANPAISQDDRRKICEEVKNHLGYLVEALVFVGALPVSILDEKEEGDE